MNMTQLFILLLQLVTITRLSGLPQFMKLNVDFGTGSEWEHTKMIDE